VRIIMAVLPRRREALRKLPCEIECGRNHYPTGEVDESMFPVDGDAEQTILGT